MAVESELFDIIASKLNLSQHISFEWSLRIEPNCAYVRDKVICWISNHGNNAYVELASMNQLIKAFSCPDLVLDRQKEIPLSAILNQGFGFSNSGKAEYCLYLHYSGEDTLRNQYVAFPWSGGDDVGKDASDLEYEFHYLPMTPTGDTPDKWIHPVLLPTYQGLLKNPRLMSMSGFWLRKNNHQVDQISLTYPWQPPVHEFINDLSFLTVGTQVKVELQRYKEHHFRHVTFNSGSSPTPTITLYFSSNAGGCLPRNFDEMQQIVKEQSRRQHQWIEDILFKEVIVTY